jgi:ATP-dependent Lon protease
LAVRMIKTLKVDSDFAVVGSQAELPLVTIKDAVLFPHNVIPVGNLVGFTATMLKQADRGNFRVGVVTVSESADDWDEVYSIGTEGPIVQIMKLPDGTTGAIVKGERRFIARTISQRGKRHVASVSYIEDRGGRMGVRARATLRAIKNDVARIARTNQFFPNETISRIQFSEDPDLVCNVVAPYLSIQVKSKVKILALNSIGERMKVIHQSLLQEIDLNRLSDRINRHVEGDLRELQRRTFIKEQIRVLKTELGEMEGESNDFDRFEATIEKLNLPAKAKKDLMDELERLQMSTIGSPEYFVSYNYLQFALGLPWDEEQPKIKSWRSAVNTLQRSHFGLSAAKEKVLDHLALHRHTGEVSGQILLLDGPPGVGKTSLAKAMAEALGRPFARIALGGLKDEAEIRGHRRTYIGSMAGNIMQAVRSVNSRHAVILLDELDKVGVEGAQSAVVSALLEILDPEQNKEFVDHYLGVPFDLSGVLFVATSNDLNVLSEALLDRMELVEVFGYSEREKVQIARKYLLPEMRQRYGLGLRQSSINDRLVQHVIRNYTRESGVRDLRRIIHTIGTKIIRTSFEGRRGASTKAIKVDDILKWLGAPKYIDQPNGEGMPGCVDGLAYTAQGGEMMPIEASMVPRRITGDNGLKVTGSLGAVLRESAETAWSCLMSCEALDCEALRSWASSSWGVHCHFPDAATPKDGPSAGVAIFVSMLSAITRRGVSPAVALTGEISLRGDVLAVGGVREKLLAAVRAGKTTVYLSKHNKVDVERIGADDLEGVEIVYLHNVADLACKLGFSEPSVSSKVPVEASRFENTEEFVAQDALNSFTSMPGQV